MPRLLKGFLIITFLLSFYPLRAFAVDEELTITTYYPSPYGVYNTLRIYPDTTFNPTPGVTACTDEGELRYSEVSAELFMCQKDPDATPAYALRWRAMGRPGRNCQNMSGAGTYMFDSSQGAIWWNEPFTSTLLNPDNNHTAWLSISGTMRADATGCLFNAKMNSRVQYMKTDINGNNEWLLWRTLGTFSVTAAAGDNETIDIGGSYTWAVDPAKRYKFRVQGQYPNILTTNGEGYITIDVVEVCFD